MFTVNNFKGSQKVIVCAKERSIVSYSLWVLCYELALTFWFTCTRTKLDVLDKIFFEINHLFYYTSSYLQKSFFGLDICLSKSKI